MVCYRRRGHNEGDDPSLTQPLMYNLIEAKRSVRKLYTEALIGRGDITVEEAEAGAARLPGAARAGLRRDPRRPTGGRRRELRRHRRRGHRPRAAGRAGADAGATPHCATDTAISPRWSSASATRTSTSPEGFTVHPKLAPAAASGARRWSRGRHRLGRWASSSPSARCCIEGAPVRLAGPGLPPRHVRAAARGHRRPRDRRRVDAAALPRRGPGAGSGSTTRCSREFAAMGFEYGYSVARPGRPGAVGGAVRRLRQRRADDHRRVHLLGRAEVGPALVGRPAAAARLRGPGPGPLLGAASSASCSCAPRTT